MCTGVELVISIITGTLFLLSEVLPYYKKKFKLCINNECDEEVNSVHQLLNIGLKKIKTRRNLNEH